VARVSLKIVGKNAEWLTIISNNDATLGDNSETSLVEQYIKLTRPSSKPRNDALL